MSEVDVNKVRALERARNLVIMKMEKLSELNDCEVAPFEELQACL